MAINKLIKVRKIAEESFNNQETKITDLTLFAMQLGVGESPKRFLKAQLANVNGMLLITDEQLIFIGKSSTGNNMGVDINYNYIVNVNVEVDKLNRKFANLIISDEEEYYKFMIGRFGAERWAEYVRERV